MKLYLIRHGQTDWNVAGKIQGSHDSELNENGISQAKALGAKLLDSGLKFSKIYSSTQKRAFKTAEIISGITKKPLEAVKGLEEISLGAWEGLTWEEVIQKYSAEYKRWRQDLRYAKAPEGESYQEMLERVLAALHRIIQTNSEDAAVVTHGAVIMCLRCYITNTPFEKMREFQAKNTSVLEISSDMLG